MPQEEKSIIRSLIDPTIVLDEMFFDDVEEGTNNEAGERGAKESKRVGNVYPLLKVNEYVVSPDEIIKFEIDNSGFLPTIELIMEMTGTSTFKSTSIPKDGDLLNVFIRGRDDLFKPIRNDYLITEVVSSKSVNEQGDGGRLTLFGELFIPRFRDELTKGFKGTSYTVLQEIAEELGLGFASNETSTEDSQSWICANDQYANFIRHISGGSWKNEESFFDVFIDVYYHLNFVNVNNQFSNSLEIDDALLDTLLTDDGLSEEKIDTTTAKKIFTNITDKRGTPSFIKRYKLDNQSSSIAATYGYKMHCQFFEQNTLEKWDIYAEPLIVPGSADTNILLKGRPGENFYETQVKRRWAGLQYSLPEHNVHEKYLYSKIHNLINRAELEKMTLHIEVPRANFNIYRGERIPCIFVATGDPIKSQFIKSPEEEASGDDSLEQPGGPTVDNFYTGFYMIKGMIFTYEARNKQDPSIVGNFYEDVILTRRVWPTPF